MMGGGMMGASYDYGTTGYGSAAYRPAYMMGGGSDGGSTMMRTGLTHDGGLGPATIVATAVGLLILAAIASMLVIVRRRTRTVHPHSA